MSTATVWLTGFKKVLGLTQCPGQQGVLYGVGSLRNGTNIVFSFSPHAENVTTIIATVDKLPNGLDCHNNGMLYTTSEGKLLPGSHSGALYSISTGHRGAAIPRAQLISGHLESADGLWIDQKRGILYVGQLFVGNVLRFSLANVDAPPVVLPGLDGAGWLDDFTLTPDGASILGCNWLRGQLVKMSTTAGAGGTTVVLTDDLRHPTSARWANASTLFVTEGNIFFKDYQRKRDALSLPIGSGHLMSVTFM